MQGGIHGVEIVFLLLLLFVVVFGALARKLQTPYPIVLVLGGLLMPSFTRRFSLLFFNRTRFSLKLTREARSRVR